MDFYLYSLISNMTAENIYYALGKESTIWSTYILEGYASCMVYPFTIVMILIILYYPLIITFTLIYITNFMYFVWKKIGNLPEDTNSPKWDKPRQVLSLLPFIYGKILHRYEVSGIENLPEGPAILVYYHGATPIDYYLFVYKIYALTGRFCYSVIDHVLFRLPGLKLFLSAHHCESPTRENCVKILKQGHMLGIAPGGIREQNYGDNYYKIIWGKRKGFAELAIDTKVPIIPLFTQNIREGYRVYGNIRPMRWLYEKTRLLIFPYYGMFPVKLTTHIGKPIPYDPNITAEKVVEKAQRAIEALRDEHQKIPGSIWQAVRERFETQKDKQ